MMMLLRRCAPHRVIKNNLESSKGSTEDFHQRGINPRHWIMPNSRDYYINGVSLTGRGNKKGIIQEEP